MGKKIKISRKRQERRERAKLRTDGVLSEDSIDAQGQAADVAVELAGKAVADKSAAGEKKAPKAADKTAKSDDPWVKVKRFFQEVGIERKKINWPSPDETWKSTMVTVVVILSLSIFMGLCSALLAQGSNKLFGVSNPVFSGNMSTSNGADVTPTPLGGTGDSGSGADSGSTNPAGTSDTGTTD